MDIKKLIVPNDTPVETSIGRLYVRHRQTADFFDPEALGQGDSVARAIAYAYSSEARDKSKFTPLSPGVASQLTDIDVKKILTVVANQCGLADKVSGSDIATLGELIKQDLVRDAAQHSALMDSIRKQYASLGSGLASSFQDQALKRIEMLKAPASRVLEVDVRRYDPPRIENPLLAPIRDSANSSRETARKVDELTDVMGGLHKAVMNDFLPTWMEQVESAEKQTQQSLGISREAVDVSRQGVESSRAANQVAIKGLYWTRFTVGVSVLVFLLGLVWQAWWGQDDSRKVYQELRNVESRMQELQETVGRQAKEIEALRERQQRAPQPFVDADLNLSL